MARVQIKGSVISNDDKWIYDWFGMETTSPKDLDEALIAADGEDLEVEINSGGGSVFAGSEIYTALKGYKGKKTVSIVGLAASAASVIAMAGNIVRISPTAQIMIHNVSSNASGDYRDLEHEAEVIKNLNKSIANAYILKTGKIQEELLALMDKETWLNAQQAKEYGFVDEVMFDDNNQLVASINNVMLPLAVINKMRNSRSPDEGVIIPPVSGLANQQKPQTQPVNKTKEDETVEFKNVEELRQACPDLVAQIEATAMNTGKQEGVTEGAKAERERIQSIDEIGNTIAPELVAKAKYTEPMDAKDLAFAALKADAGKGRQYLDDTAGDSAASGVGNLSGQPLGQKSGKETEDQEREAMAQSMAGFINTRRGN